MKFFTKQNVILIGIFPVLLMCLDLTVQLLGLTEPVATAFVMLPMSIYLCYVLIKIYIYARKNFKIWRFFPLMLLLGAFYSVGYSIFVLCKSLLNPILSP